MTQSKEELLLETALKLFNEYGFHATPTSKITKEAGVSAGTLYNYFESKEDLINKLYIKTKIHFAEYMQKSWKESEDIKENFRLLWHLFIKWGLEYPDYFKFKETYAMSPFIENLSSDVVKDNFDFLIKLQERIIAQGTIKKEDMSIATAVFHGAVLNVIKHIKELTAGKEQETVIEKCFEFVWHGIVQDDITK